MKTPLLVLALATGGLVIAAGFLVHQLGVERDRAHAETLIRQRLEARVKELEQVQAMLEMRDRVTADTQPAHAASESPKVGSLIPMLPRAVPRVDVPPMLADDPSASPNAAAFNFARHREWMRSQLQNPESRAAMLGQQKAGTRMTFSDLGEELGLTTEDEDKLFDLLADQQVRAIEASVQEVNADPTAAQAAFAQGQSESDAELQAFLGPARHQQFKEYQQTLQERMELREFRGLLDADNALRADQSRELIRIMREERERMVKEAPRPGNYKAPDAAVISRMAEQGLRQAEASSRRVRERAAQVLTGEQLRRFNQIHEQRLNIQRMSIRMSRQQSEIGPAFEEGAVRGD